MRIIKPSFKFEEFDAKKMLKRIESAGRVCYNSESNITDDSSENFVKMIIARGHESVLEHEKITCSVVCDRGISHEVVRHRIASYSQESTRYCNYKGGMVFIKPCFLEKDTVAYDMWVAIMQTCEQTYTAMINLGMTPQEARSVLPNSLKTEIVMTMNLRAWRHFFKLRIPKAAHPQMREIAIPMLKYLQKMMPVVFDDIEVCE